jgi:hypothetical protein
MLKRVLMIGIAMGVGIAVLNIGTAQAQWQYLRPPGMWWWYGSLKGCGTITKVRNPDQHPARMTCRVEVTAIEILCDNPAGNQVWGEAATQVVLGGKNDIDDDDLLESKKGKKKNRADLCVTIEDGDCIYDPDTGEYNSPLCDPEFCVNPLWNPVDVLTTKFTATCDTEQCTGEDDPATPEYNEACDDGNFVVRDTQVCNCTLPPGYGIEDVRDGTLVPCPDPLNPDPDKCVAYDCFDVITGEPCEFDPQ